MWWLHQHPWNDALLSKVRLETSEDFWERSRRPSRAPPATRESPQGSYWQRALPLAQARRKARKAHGPPTSRGFHASERGSSGRIQGYVCLTPADIPWLPRLAAKQNASDVGDHCCCTYQQHMPITVRSSAHWGCAPHFCLLGDNSSNSGIWGSEDYATCNRPPITGIDYWVSSCLRPMVPGGSGLYDLRGFA